MWDGTHTEQFQVSEDRGSSSGWGGQKSLLGKGSRRVEFWHMGRISIAEGFQGEVIPAGVTAWVKVRGWKM